MKAEALQERIRKLEANALAKRPDESKETRRFLGRLNVEELRRLRDIYLRTDEWQREPTEEEACFLAELRTKYGT